MPLNEFWHGDLRLLNAYQKAYVNNIAYTSWANGKMNCIATSIAIQNAFASKGSKPVEYPQWEEPKIASKKPKGEQNNMMTQEEKERNTQKEIINQEYWFRSMINKRGD